MLHDAHGDAEAFAKEDQSLLLAFADLWADAEAVWERHENAPAFHGYVSADYRAVFDALVGLRGRATTILEWGSGLGVVTIMASRMGFDAYGIEAEMDLVDYSRDFAMQYAPQAKFAMGSFIPDAFDWNPANGDEVVRTVVDAPSGYDELDMQLRDFDLLYAYPWPDEHVLYHNIIRQFGRSDAILLSYDAREGIDVVRFDGT